MGTVAQFLAPVLEKIYVPGTFGVEAGVQPTTSRPMQTDSMWGTQHISIVHDGEEVSRTEKTAFIGGHDVVAKYLRVCSDHWEGGHEGRLGFCFLHAAACLTMRRLRLQ